jgi:hypothetical protein
MVNVQILMFKGLHVVRRAALFFSDKGGAIVRNEEINDYE